MKFGIIYNTGQLGVDPTRITAVARHAEDCGFESFYVPEHIVLYPGANLGAYPVPPDLPLADPLATLSFVAAATRRILLGTSVLLLPFHHPVVLAKELATIDVLSGGRMRLLTVGLGVLPGEAEAVGVDFAARGRRADEAIDVLRLLWAGGADGVSFEGEFYASRVRSGVASTSARWPRGTRRACRFILPTNDRPAQICWQQSASAASRFAWLAGARRPRVTVSPGSRARPRAGRS